MENETLVLDIPYGMRDFLPKEAAGKRAVETELASLFSAWGYDEVVTPTIEYLDNLTLGAKGALEPHLFKLFDRNNRTLALRHEMTTPIARLAASRLRDYPMPLKLSYISSVFRYEQAQRGRQCEFHQAGVELMGSTSTASDAEIIALAVEGLRQVGLKDFQVSIGQVDFVSGIMEQYHLDKETKSKLKTALEVRNLVEAEQIVDGLAITEQAKTILKRLPLLNGGEEMLRKSYAFALNEQSRRALDNLGEIYRLLKAYGIAQYVRFDLGIIRDFGYYTGMVFEIYASGLGFPLAGGGRYDHLLSDFGNACPATGVALGIERVLLALSRQACVHPVHAEGVYLAYAHGFLDAAIELAQKLRSEGKTVEIALSVLDEQSADDLRRQKGYGEFLYLS